MSLLDHWGAGKDPLREEWSDAARKAALEARRRKHHHPDEVQPLFKKALTGMTRNEVRDVGGVKVRRMYASYNVLSRDGKRLSAPKSLADTVASAMEHSAASTHPDSLGGAQATTLGVLKAGGRKPSAAPPRESSAGGAVPKYKRDPASSYGVSEDDWGGAKSGRYMVNHGYYGVSGSQHDVPRWTTGNSLEKADAMRLDGLRDEVSDAVMNWNAHTKSAKHTEFGKAFFGDRDAKPQMRLHVEPHPDGSFTLWNYDHYAPWKAVVRKGQRPKWESAPHPKAY